MSGEEVKEKLKQEGIVFSELARLLGYDSDQRLHSALKANDVRSGLIEDISEKFISLLEKKDEQINRLLDIIEGFRKDK